MSILFKAVPAIIGVGFVAVAGGIAYNFTQVAKVYDEVEVQCNAMNGEQTINKKFKNARVWPTEQYTLVRESDTGTEFQAPKHCAITKTNFR